MAKRLASPAGKHSKEIVPPSQNEAPSRMRQTVAKGVVWAIWCAMTISSFVYTAAYISAVPRHDYWEVVPEISGASPVTWSWLWRPHNEHRIPLPKLAIVAIVRATGDTRAPAAVSVAILSLLAALLIRTAQRLRGAASLADAFFPIALLHIGQFMTLLWPFQATMAIPAALMLLAVATATRVKNNRFNAEQIVSIGVCLLLLPFVGMPGVLFLPPLAIWTIWAAFRQHRESRSSRLRNGLLWLPAALGLAATGWVLIVHSPAQQQGRLNFSLAACSTAVQFASVGFGQGVADAFHGVRIWIATAVACFVLAAASCAILARRWARLPGDRTRTEGIAAILAGTAILAVGVAVGRADLGPDAGLQDRYTLLSAPFLIGLFFVGVVDGQRLSRWIPWALLAMSLIVLPANIRFGLQTGQWSRSVFKEIEDNMSRGFPPEALARLYNGFLVGGEPAILADRFSMLQNARMLPKVELPADESALLLSRFGVAFLQRNRRDAAAELFEAALKRDPNCRAARQGLRFLERERGDAQH